jgi:DUF1680 family protein
VRKAPVSYLLAFLLQYFVQCFGQQSRYSDYPISMLDIKAVEMSDGFWLPKIRMVQNTTIAYAFDKCEKEGRLENFLIAGGKMSGKVMGKMPFDDTDVYKIIEGASCSLISAPNKELDAYLDSVIAIIRTGQEPDGYLTTWFTIDPMHPPASWVPKTGKRWTGEAGSHELYNSGHLFEAAAAHYAATGKRTLLDIAIKNADLLVQSFGPGKCTMPPGHQIVETGLVKLFRITHNVKYPALAKYFLDLRGDSTTHRLYGEYSQDHMPVVRQTEIVGHAVRAVYMYAGMTDIAALCKDSAYLSAVMTIWNNMVEKKMYLTGGIGAKHEGESFGKDYELPNLTAYGETCASIGDVYWNTRLFTLTGDAKYFDVIERTLYNGLLSGISLDGKCFFYVNPLEADGKFRFNSGAGTRRPWFDCSCCPTNLIRFIPSLPGLLYAVQKDTFYINLYASSIATVSLGNTAVRIEQRTDYPWHGKIRIKVTPERSGQFTLKLRLPGWARNKVLPGDLYEFADTLDGKAAVRLNGEEVPYAVDRGYATMTRIWEPGDSVAVDFPMNIRRVEANRKVKDDENLIALEYGPLVYCVEGIDNDDRVSGISLPDNAVLKLERRMDLLNGVNVIVGDVPTGDGRVARRFTAIPYYAWSNRGEGTMKVWLARE